MTDLTGLSGDVGAASRGAAWQQRRPAILRVCSGEALAITTADATLVDLINDAAELFDLIIDREADPDDIRLPEMFVERMCDRHGIDRIGGGVRVSSVVSYVARYLIPESVELVQRLPEARKGVGQLRIHDLKRTPQMLAGAARLPAATVAADHLGRRGYQCLWLTLDDAAAVTVGGRKALNAAINDALVPTHPDVRTGADVVSPADLRNADLLIERDDKAHGLAESTAGNIISVVQYTLKRARACGANLRGDFEFPIIPPLPNQRMRKAAELDDYVSIALVLEICRGLGVVSQVCLWLMRLAGLRISEAFGLRVRHFYRDPETGRGMLTIEEQGGGLKSVRDEETGRIGKASSKKGLKVGKGRTIPIVEPLARLIELLIDIFHREPDGTVREDARILPGLRNVDEAGQEVVRRHLEAALANHDILFTPHGMRGFLITDLENLEVPERIKFGYVGHTNPRQDIQTRSYIAAPKTVHYLPAVEALEALIAEEIGEANLHAPTETRQRWTEVPDSSISRDLINARLLDAGWLKNKGSDEDPFLSAAEASRLLGCTDRQARRYMLDGLLTWEMRPWGKRLVRHARTSDVLRLREDLARPTIADLAEELGLTYAQVWHMLDRETKDSEAATGTRVRLSEDTVSALRAEYHRRQQVAARAMSVHEAASVLELPVTTIGTLIRAGHLELTEGPTDGRDRYITRASVSIYGKRFPARQNERTTHGAARRGHGEHGPLLRCKEAAQVMGMSRPTLSVMGRTRQISLVPKKGSRHVYVAAESVREWARREGKPEVEAALDRLLVARQSATQPQQSARSQQPDGQ